MRQIKGVLDVMTDNEVKLVHDTSMRILADVGLEVPNQEVLKKLQANGAEVDFDKQVAKMPVKVMEDFIAEVQKKCGFRDFPHRNKLSGSISTQVFYYDYETRSRRYGLRDDILKGIKLIETLDNFWGTSAVVVPSDVPDSVADIEGFFMVYSYAKKEGGTFILTEESAKYIVEMSNVMGRGCGYFLETVSPLRFRKESLDMAVSMNKMGCGVSIGPMVIGGAIGPVTIAGNVALQNAEILGSMFVGHAITGQLDFGYGSFNHTMDLKTMLCTFGAPNQALLGMAAGQMGRYYGLWSVSNSGLTDSLLPDYQCGMEKASNAIFGLLAGNGGIGGQGIVGADQGLSLEQLVLDDRFMSTYNYIMSGFDVDEETLALEIIKEVGIGGDFVSEEHTVVNMRESNLASDIMNRSDFDAWKIEGGKSAYDKAHEYVEEVTKGYKDMQPIVSDSVYEELVRLRKDAFKTIAKQDI